MQKMKNVLKNDKLEELLVANWTKFLDSGKIMAFVLSTVRDRLETLARVPSAEFRSSGTRLTVSRFQITRDGFIIWVEFMVPIEQDMAIGTTELLLNSAGDISHIQTLGNVYQNSTQRPIS